MLVQSTAGGVEVRWFSRGARRLRYVRKADVVSTEMDDELVMMNITQGVYFGMNAVGKEIWKLLDQPRDEQEVVDLLLEKFDVDETTCRSEAAAFIQLLAKNKLVDIV